MRALWPRFPFLLLVFRLTDAGENGAQVVQLRFQRGLDPACMGVFEQARQKFSEVADLSPQHVGSLHSLATMELVLAGDLKRVGALHNQAVAVSKETPSLAQMYQVFAFCWL
jgi:hypothetical protein